MNINKPYVFRIISNGKIKINKIIINFLVETLHRGQGYSEIKSNKRYKKKIKLNVKIEVFKRVLYIITLSCTLYTMY